MPYNLQNNSRLPLPDMNQLAGNRMTQIAYKDKPLGPPVYNPMPIAGTYVKPNIRHKFSYDVFARGGKLSKQQREDFLGNRRDNKNLDRLLYKQKEQNKIQRQRENIVQIKKRDSLEKVMSQYFNAKLEEMTNDQGMKYLRSQMTKEELELYGNSQYEQMDYLKHLVGTGEAKMHDNRQKQAVLDYFNLRQPKVSQAYQTNKSLKEITDKIDGMKPKDKAKEFVNRFPDDGLATPIDKDDDIHEDKPSTPVSPAKPSTPVGSPAKPSTPVGSPVKPSGSPLVHYSSSDEEDVLDLKLGKPTSADISPGSSSATGAEGILGGLTEIGLNAKGALDEMGVPPVDRRSSIWDAIATMKWGSLDAIDDINFKLARSLLDQVINVQKYEPEEAEANDAGVITRINDLIFSASIPLHAKPEALFTGLCEALGIESGVIAKYYNHPDLYGKSHITTSENPSPVGAGAKEGSSVHALPSGKNIATGVEDIENPYRVNLNKKALNDRTVTRDPRYSNTVYPNYSAKVGADGKREVHQGLIELRDLGLLDENFIGTKKGDEEWSKNKRGDKSTMSSADMQSFFRQRK